MRVVDTRIFCLLVFLFDVLYCKTCKVGRGRKDTLCFQDCGLSLTRLWMFLSSIWF